MLTIVPLKLDTTAAFGSMALGQLLQLLLMRYRRRGLQPLPGIAAEALLLQG
jgi:hypothetical protein